MDAKADGHEKTVAREGTMGKPHDSRTAASGEGYQEADENPPCALCGGPHPFDTTVPSVRWNHVIRRAGLPEYLCLTCIVSAFVQAGESFTADLVGGPHYFEPIEVRTRSQNAIDAQRLSEENTQLRAMIRGLAAAWRDLATRGLTGATRGQVNRCVTLQACADELDRVLSTIMSPTSVDAVDPPARITTD